MRLSVGRKLSPWARIAAWLTAPRAPVEFCARCHAVRDGDTEMRRRSSRRCESYDVCTGTVDMAMPGEPESLHCIHLRVVWS